jgi:acyl-CoA synthetase (AMP-forming)/AMP-acid ligase II
MSVDAGVVELEKIKREVESMQFAENLPALLDTKALEHPDRILADFFEAGVKLTYADLASQSKCFANSLARLGVRKGTHVAIVAPNSSAYLVSWFAIGRIGAVMIPVNHRYVSRELEFVLTDADAQFLIIDESCLPTFEEIAPCPPLLQDGEIIVIGKEAKGCLSFDEVASQSSADFIPTQPVTQSDLLAIQFTSGSTGFPKGCMQSHMYWLLVGVAIDRLRRAADNQPSERVLITYPFFYMMAQMEFLLAIYTGGTAFIANKPSLTKFMTWVKTYRIHYCAMNPMVYRGLPPDDGDHDNELRFIAAYYHTGDTLRELEARFNTVGRDSYGMTETGSGTIMPAAATHMLDSASCGLPSLFREFRILDEQGNELPPGENGELCMAGKGMFWGYYKRPKTNRESFHGRWFRTGDLARVDENGYIYIVGRIKEMIKRSGENISAGEVEKIVREHPDIREVAAVAMPDPQRMEEVKIVVTLRNNKTKNEITPEVLRKHCEDRLAAFKVPRYIAYIEKFPRTGSAKIAKPELVNPKADLKCDTYDTVRAEWI